MANRCRGPPPAEFWTAEQVVRFRDNDYQIVEKLGQGGIGIAYKVARLDPRTEEALGHYVAKVVLEAPTGRVVLESYRRVHAHLRHSGLSTIFEVAREWQENSILALLTWIEGEPLTDYLGVLGLEAEERSDGDTQTRLLGWLRELCRALDVLHRNDLVHGDVSPGNLILTDREIVLTDYDLVTRIGQIASSPGTSLYCSPSRAEQHPAAPSDDFYALAASFFHALFGTKPFQYEGNRSKDRGLNWEGTDSAEFPVIQRFLNRATDPKAERRYSSAVEALADLDAQPGESPSISTEPDPLQAKLPTLLQAHWLPKSWHIMRCGWVLNKYTGLAIMRQLMRDFHSLEQILDEDVLSAVGGDSHAQYGLGVRYYSGNQVRQDYAKAAEWYRVSAEQGYVIAQHDLGKLYQLGQGVLENVEEAARWYRKAAEQGSMEAQYDLGEFYRHGVGVAKDHAQAATWHRMSAEQGHANAQYRLGVLYDQGLGVDRDFSEAEKWCIKSAENGHAEAQYWLGNFYDCGRNGVVRNQSKAPRWYRKAAEQGHAEAQYSLGMVYNEMESQGTYGVKRNSVEAVKWYRKAAKQGHDEAPFYLGILRSQPLDGMAEDCVEAAKWWRMGAERGHEFCQYWLGWLCHEGCDTCGVERNPAEAARWYREAAEQSDMDSYTARRYREAAKQGDAEAQYQLGNLYRLGKGVPQNYVEAEDWYRKAAEQDHAEAQYWLGRLYESGLGVERNNFKVAKWYGKAAERILDIAVKEHITSTGR